MNAVEQRIQAAIDHLHGPYDAGLGRQDLALEELARGLEAARAPHVDRKRLPDERESITCKVEIAKHDFYITVGLYPDDHQPGEVFIKSSKEGSTLSGLLDTIGILLSLALQYHVPLKAITDKLTNSRFEPAGWTGREGIEYAKSPVDFLARWMSRKFLPTEAEPVEVPPMVSMPPAEPKEEP